MVIVWWNDVGGLREVVEKWLRRRRANTLTSWFQKRIPTALSGCSTCPTTIATEAARKPNLGLGEKEPTGQFLNVCHTWTKKKERLKESQVPPTDHWTISDGWKYGKELHKEMRPMVKWTGSSDVGDYGNRLEKIWVWIVDQLPIPQSRLLPRPQIEILDQVHQLCQLCSRCRFLALVCSNFERKWGKKLTRTSIELGPKLV